MSFNFSKSKFVSTYTTCNKYAWLDKYKKEEKTAYSEFTKYLFEIGHVVGDLAKKYFNIDADATVLKEDGSPNNAAMIEVTKKLLEDGAKVIAEATFAFDGLFCSVDILEKTDDGTYNIYEVKSSKIEPKKKKGYYKGVKERYVIDAAYQKYVLENCGYEINKVFVVLLADDYVRGEELDLKGYFKPCEVTERTTLLQDAIKNKLDEIDPVINSENEPDSMFTQSCQYCDYFAYCKKCKGVPTPSPFDLFDIDFKDKCDLYNNGISFFDVEAIEDRLELIQARKKLRKAAKNHIKYYNYPNEIYMDKAEIKKFLDSLIFPLYALDFETYQAKVPEREGISTGEAVPFQYSLHIIKTANDIMTGQNLEEKHFIDISGEDSRREIAERLVNDIPFGACVIACNMGTESGIIKKLAEMFEDLHDHLMSFGYVDPQDLFQNGHYYNARMGNSFSIKSILPALYPDDADMNYQNLEGEVKNGGEAMNAIHKAKQLEGEALEKYKQDLVKYCALDTYAIVKVLKKLYEAI